MSNLPAIRAANAAFTLTRTTSPVAVFVGGTSGIGEATLRAFTTSTISPRIYFVGRSQPAADAIKTSLLALNPTAKLTFLPADLSLLSSTLSVAQTIRDAEPAINLLFLSAGYLAISGPAPTTELIERKLAVNYFSRLLFAQALLPRLRAAQDSDPLGARVVSVYAPRDAGPVKLNDLALLDKQNFSMRQAAAQGTAMTTLAFEHLAAENPGMGWIHASPGVVNTGITRDLPWWARTVIPLFGFLATGIEECGQGFLRIVTGSEYRRGLWLVDWKGKDLDNRQVSAWWKEGLAKEVWEGTWEVWERVLGKEEVVGLGR